MVLFLIVSVFVLSFLSGIQCADNVTEGSPCLDGEKNGTCVNLYKCSVAAKSYLYTQAGLAGSVPPMPPICSYREDGEPIVCCTLCKLDEEENMRYSAVVPPGNLIKKNGSKAYIKCLDYFRDLPYRCRGLSFTFIAKKWDDAAKCDNELIYGAYGGTPAKVNEFPHMALLGYGPDRESAQWLCGGSIISERFILTAAHCASTPLLGPITYAGLGVLKRGDLDNYWKIYSIMSIIKHPDYKAPAKYHDIALLKTKTEINFGKAILPACVDGGDKFVTMSNAEATGWGRDGPKGALVDHLQVMKLVEYTAEECSTLFPQHRLLKNGYDNKTQMCYGRKDRIVDTCEGDSGGPLQVDTLNCIYFVFGITSYGKDCGIPGNAGMYTRVASYLPWIESIVWPDA